MHGSEVFLIFNVGVMLDFNFVKTFCKATDNFVEGKERGRSHIDKTII